MTRGEELRDKGMAMAGANAEHWREIIRVRLFLVAKRNAELTGSLLQEDLDASGFKAWKHSVSPNVLGAAFKFAESQGWITCTGETRKATHDEGHARRQMLWKSNLYQE